MSILDGVVEELGVVVLVRKEEGFFQLINNQCIWFRSLLELLACDLPKNSAEIDSASLCAAFPFIENFLIDADTVWETTDAESVRSGIWTETDPFGYEHQLEARACQLDGQAVLLIENHTASFSERHGVYQKARDIALLNEKLASELNQRQRELQSEIERHILQDTSIQSVAESVKGHTSAVMICQPGGQIEVINKALIDIYQISDEADLKRVSLLDQWISEAEKQYPELKRVIENGSYWEGEFESKSSGGLDRWVRLTIGPIKDDDGSVSHYVCVANDISEFRNMDAAGGGDGGYDFTTHLPNRRHFWRHINNVAEAGLAGEYGIGLMYIDLDYFKRVNDSLGHQAGDFLLSAIASRISRCVKHHDFVAHLGGDEFVVLVRYIEDVNQLSIVADRLLASIHEPLFVNGQSILMSASIGITTQFEKQFDPTLLVRQADLAMYAAKELGKGQSRFYDPSMECNIPHKLQRERELIDAVDRQEFVLHLQPQISISGEEEVRVEALIRWQHPVHGLLHPADFIAIAEDSGLIIPIGSWVLQQACRIGVDLLGENKRACIAVNISAKQLKHPDFYKILTKTLTETNFPAPLLELEITESCFLEDLNTVISLIENIRKLGVTIALDDFGTGFSSLNYLRQLPVDYLKIDRSFIQGLQVDRESQAITSSVINLAHELNIDVIAEGVETAEQFDFLRCRQVHFVQGYLFYKPLSVSSLVKSYRQIKSLNDKNKLDQ
ncbi:putative bifunctional diguanylate cyclase/phosphodiesterase [Alkalimarinus coralli]|uniref:putative bifunctional diguanylate cyclase/phosphodiesterase n=1 Tax=Alkalimarinus coralli TaxID=2935863 RepID=UPI00202B870C|nr:GGDEF and EAL domain-containing protein [Alkalimarinus coralli]